MNHQSAIRALLETRLAAWAAARVPPLPVLWENDRSDAEPTTEHLRAYLLPATTTTAYLEGDGRTYQGLFQVTAFLLPGTGPRNADLIVAQLDALYPCFAVLTDGAVDVQLMAPAAALPAEQEPSWHVVVVRMRYRCDV